MITKEIRNWLEKQIGHIESETALVGGITTSIYRLSMKNGGAYVLRLYDNEEMLTEEPDICHQEAAALSIASQTVKAPKLIAHEPSTRYGYPLLVMQALEGKIILQPLDRADWLKQSAETLAAIHQLNAPDFAWHYSSHRNAEAMAIPKWAKNRDAWQKALEILKSPEPLSPPCFIHRDYHPTNLLWQNGQLSGVVDWISACIGTAGNDIAHMRVNLAALYDYQVADTFLAAYQAAAPDFVYHPYWDLLGIADFHLSDSEVPFLYQPWLDLGMSHLSHELMLERAENYLASVLARF